MKKPMMVAAAALFALGMFGSVNRASAQQYPDKNDLIDTYPSMREATPALMSPADEDFIVKVGHDDRAEIKFSELALDRSSNPAIQQFAQRMITDHTEINDRLKRLADYWSVLLPLTLDDRDKKAYDHLSNLSGADFDRAFINWQIRAHDKAIDLFKDRQGYSSVDDVTNFTSKTLPTLRDHLRMAKDLKNGTSSSSSPGSMNK